MRPAISYRAARKKHGLPPSSFERWQIGAEGKFYSAVQKEEIPIRRRISLCTTKTFENRNKFKEELCVHTRGYKALKAYSQRQIEAMRNARQLTRHNLVGGLPIA